MFRIGMSHLEVTDESKSGQPNSATTEKNPDAAHVMILNNPRISAKVIADTLGISMERDGNIIHNIMDMRHFTVKWVLNA